MTRYRFERFLLDPADRRLTREGAPVELNARYLDALALMVREQGRLVSKDRFLEEVWSGVPVTDEALTQCVRTLRRQLGDDAARPRFIETVPKHGYRFIAEVDEIGAAGGDTPPAVTPQPRGDASAWQNFWLTGVAGTAGGGVAGLLGGLVYGFGAAAQPLAPGMGAVSVLLVLVALTVLVALAGAAGVSFGIAAGAVAAGRPWYASVGGGALGGLLVGATVKLLAIDGFNLLFGQTPGDITGAAEGALLGAAVGLGVWLGGAASLRRALAGGGLAGGAAGLAIALTGGRMMGGSLDVVALHSPNSRLRLDHIAALFGEGGFGPLSEAATAAMEGALFGACVAGAMLLARRTFLSPR